MEALEGLLLCVDLALFLNRVGLLTLYVLPQHRYCYFFLIDDFLKFLCLQLHLLLELVGHLRDEQLPFALCTLLQELLVYA